MPGDIRLLNWLLFVLFVLGKARAEDKQLTVKGRRLHNVTNNAWTYDWSCDDADYPPYMGTCDMVNWISATVYRWHDVHDGNTTTRTREMLRYEDLNSLAAQARNDDTLMPGLDSGGCSDHDRLRVACGYFFRRCRHGRPEMEPQDMCKSVCDDYEQCHPDLFSGVDTAGQTKPVGAPLCNNIFHADDPPNWKCDNNSAIMEQTECLSGPSDEDCVYVPNEGYFLLDIEYGPYGAMPYIYGLAASFWGVLTLFWFYKIVWYQNAWPHEESNGLLRAMLCLPAAKALFCVISFAFWYTCLEWGQCSYWLNIGRNNCKLIYETVFFLNLLLIGKGWFIVRTTFLPSELRRTVLVVCLFYLGDSLLMVLQNVSQWFYWTLATILYGFLLWYIASQATKNLRILEATLLQLPVGSDGFRKTMVKFRFFLNFRLLLFIFVVCALVLHGLGFSMEHMAIWPHYLALELVEGVAFVVLCYLLRFRPNRELFATHGSAEEQNTVPMLAPIMTADMEALSVSVVEEGSRSRRSSTPRRQKPRSPGTVVIVQNPAGDFDVVVGVRSSRADSFSPAANGKRSQSPRRRGSASGPAVPLPAGPPPAWTLADVPAGTETLAAVPAGTDEPDDLLA